jgi:hypothetical protein
MAGTAETALLSPESIKMISEVRDYLTTVTVEITIDSEEQKVGATALGNELQKKFKAIDTARTTEKKVWDAKAKAVQEQFKPILDIIEDKKKRLGAAIQVWNDKVELERQKRQRELDDQTNKQRAALEARAGTQAERAAMYQKKVAEAQAAFNAETDQMKKAQLYRDIVYYQAKVKEFEDKSETTTAAAEQVQAPIFQPEAPTANKGTRKTVEYQITVKDKAAFVGSCLAKGDLHFLIIDEQKLKSRAKESEGQNPPPGIEFTVIQKTGFSGR